MKMKKTIVKLTSLFMAAAMVFTLSGCSSESEIEKTLSEYEQYNHILQTNESGEKINFYSVGETEEGYIGYDTVRTSCNDYSGYSIFITGKYGCTLEEEYEQVDSGGEKYSNFLDKYKLEKNESGCISLDPLIADIDEEYELNEQDGKKIFTSKENGETVTFEDTTITVESKDSEGNTIIETYQFNNVDDNYYENAAKEIQNLNGATRAQIKEKLGQFIEDNLTK
ncbi:hypothetical protein [Thomasclavelia sp.]|uniref:hypothetical protein n=1 Tax=Thomasclavelia sp. TaxID=3025757 RepID=UPI0025E7E22D|nr:hypothetical protein [Thomasclavelia sp.]